MACKSKSDDMNVVAPNKKKEID